jgi:hypothetical protein
MPLYCVETACLHTASWSGPPAQSSAPMYCASHAPSGSRMVKYRCVYGLCPVVHATHAPWVGAESRWCRAHRPAGSVNVVHRRCGFIGCPKVNPAFGAPGESRGQYCKTHRLPGMVDVRSRRCGHEGCTVLNPAGGFCRRHRGLSEYLRGDAWYTGTAPPGSESTQV